MNLTDIGQAVRSRRMELGLTQDQLARLAGLSRQTLVGLERGTLNDLGLNRVGRLLSVLGLESTIPAPKLHLQERGLWMAARNASVSYREELTEKDLASALASGEAAPRFRAHLMHFLDETPIPVVVMAVTEAASQTHRTPRSIWANVARLARDLSIHRRALWT